MRPSTRAQLMDYFGAKQKNTMWSWCAVNENEKSVYLSVWTDLKNLYGDKGRHYYTIQEPDWGVNDSGVFSPARKDHDEKLSNVFSKGYKVYGYFVVAKDKTMIPREIQETKTSFVFELELEKLDDGTVIGYPMQRVEVR